MILFLLFTIIQAVLGKNLEAVSQIEGLEQLNGGNEDLEQLQGRNEDLAQPDLYSSLSRIISELDDSWHKEIEVSETSEEERAGFGRGSYGGQCTTPCGKHGYTYTWCRTRASDPGNWKRADYCSTSPTITYQGKPCRSDCMQDDQKYYWCWTLAPGSWGYCSPSSAQSREADASVEVVEEGLVEDQEARDQSEIPLEEDLLEYLYLSGADNAMIPALEDRLSHLYNGVSGEERVNNLNTIIRMAQLDPPGVDGREHPHF